MTYTVRNFRSAAELKRAILEAGPGRVAVWEPGPFGPEVRDGVAYLEGPHYPEPHNWYVCALVRDGYVVRVIR